MGVGIDRPSANPVIRGRGCVRNLSLFQQYYNENVRRNPSMGGVNLSANKTKAVAWFVSNCGARNGRLAYAKELQKYIQVCANIQGGQYGQVQPIQGGPTGNYTGN